MEEFSSNSGDHFPFKKNPLGRPLLRNTIDHYKKLGDVQMVAMLASVFAQTFPEQHLCQLVKNVNLTVAEKSNSLPHGQSIARLRFNSENLDEQALRFLHLRTSSEGENPNDNLQALQKEVSVHNKFAML